MLIHDDDIRNNMSSYPVGVMAYAARNGHRDILDAVAPHTLAKSARTMYEALPPAYMIAWVRTIDAPPSMGVA